MAQLKQECIPVGCVLVVLVIVVWNKWTNDKIIDQKLKNNFETILKKKKIEKKNWKKIEKKWGSLHQPPWEQTPPNFFQTPRSRHPPGADPPWSRPPGSRCPPRPDTTPLLTESQTPVKTLPCPNFVAGSNKVDNIIIAAMWTVCEKLYWIPASLFDFDVFVYFYEWYQNKRF